MVEVDKVPVAIIYYLVFMSEVPEEAFVEGGGLTIKVGILSTSLDVVPSLPKRFENIIPDEGEYGVASTARIVVIKTDEFLAPCDGEKTLHHAYQTDA